MRSDLYIEGVLRKCQVLKHAGLWAAEPKIRPTAWLHNFTAVEKPVAAVLLDHFVFFSAGAVDRMLTSGYRRLRDELIEKSDKTAALDILNRVVFTGVEGEDPNVTDSGKLFCRKLRQILGLPEDRFLEPRDVIGVAAQGTPVIFLDDFIGSGDQFIRTWTRQYQPRFPQSFAEASGADLFKAMSINLVATEYGLARIKAAAPKLALTESHKVADEYGVRKLPRTPFLPDVQDIPGGIEALLDKYATMLRVPNYMSSTQQRKYGHHELGLSLAFEHTTPDATLPLFWAEVSDKWTPLVRRS